MEVLRKIEQDDLLKEFKDSKDIVTRQRLAEKLRLLKEVFRRHRIHWGTHPELMVAVMDPWTPYCWCQHEFSNSMSSQDPLKRKRCGEL